MIAGTLQTDPRSGGIKKSSGVKVLPAVAEGECDPVLCTQSYFVLNKQQLLSAATVLFYAMRLSLRPYHLPQNQHGPKCATTATRL